MLAGLDHEYHYSTGQPNFRQAAHEVGKDSPGSCCLHMSDARIAEIRQQKHRRPPCASNHAPRAIILSHGKRRIDGRYFRYSTFVESKPRCQLSHAVKAWHDWAPSRIGVVGLLGSPNSVDHRDLKSTYRFEIRWTRVLMRGHE